MLQVDALHMFDMPEAVELRATDVVAIDSFGCRRYYLVAGIGEQRLVLFKYVWTFASGDVDEHLLDLHTFVAASVVDGAARGVDGRCSVCGGSEGAHDPSHEADYAHTCLVWLHGMHWHGRCHTRHCWRCHNAHTHRRSLDVQRNSVARLQLLQRLRRRRMQRCSGLLHAPANLKRGRLAQRGSVRTPRQTPRPLRLSLRPRVC